MTASSTRAPLWILLLIVGGLVFYSGSGLPRPDAFLEGSVPVPPPLALFFILIFATLISEDLTCISAGLLVSQGWIDYLPAVGACFLGIYLGDSLIFLLGRYGGRSALANPWIRRFISPRKEAAAEQFFARRGPWVIIATRFLPGSRVPTYFAVGAMRLSLPTFFGYFALAALFWTPVLVGLSVFLGRRILAWFEQYALFALPAFVLTLLGLLLLIRLLTSLSNWKGRRLWISWWQRLTRWEFWPPFAVYPPVVLYYLWLALRYRSLTLPSLANPGIPLGGWIESKSYVLGRIHRRFPEATGHLLPLDHNCPLELRKDLAGKFRSHLPEPRIIVVKPDFGERGRKVQLLHTEAQLFASLTEQDEPMLLQQFHSGTEFGVFFVRHPHAPEGRVFSVAEKKPLILTGDGRSTLEELILRHPRAICKAPDFLHRFPDADQTVPAAGEAITLAEIGSHSKGAVFINRPDLITPALTSALSRLVDAIPGFSFGRFDLKAPSEADLKAGGGIRILELNGLTSEASHIYHPHNPLWKGWRDLCRQWKWAFEIGHYHRSRGLRPPPLSLLLRVLGAYLTDPLRKTA